MIEDMDTDVPSKTPIKCPLCGLVQQQDPVKKWNYGKIIKKRSTDGTQWGTAIHCSRYCCSKCEKFFNYYVSSKDKTWTIPKAKKD